MSMPKAIPDDPRAPLPGGSKGSKGSKASFPLGMPGSGVSAFTASDQAVPLPILYGTAKVPVLLIEKAAPLITQPLTWSARFYEVGEYVQANGNAYVCIVRGTAVKAPAGNNQLVSTVGFFDGGTVTMLAWTNGEVVSVDFLRTNAGNLYRCTVAGTCGTGGPTGTGVDLIDFPGFPTQPHWTFVAQMPYGVVVDGNVIGTTIVVNVAWHYLQALPFPLNSQIVIGGLCEGEAKGAVSLWWDKTLTPALSLTSPGMGLQLLTGLDAGGQVLPVINDPFPEKAEGIGAISGTVLTVTGLHKGSFRVGMVVTGSTILSSALIVSLGTGTGAGGTYNITPSQTATSSLIEAVDATPLFDPSGYQHTALIAPLSSAGIPTGTQAELPDIAVELQGVMFGVSTPDVSPADIVNDILTHARRGSQWPSIRVDATITGSGASDFRVCCDSFGIRFSFFIDQQRSALSILADILNATDCDAIWSGGKLKIVPLCDEATTSPVFGSTNYLPANTAKYDLTPNDFLKDPGGPVQVVCADYADTFNSYPVEFVDRHLYATTRVEDFDQIDVEARGFPWRGPTVTLPVIFPDGTVPVMLSRRLTQRSLYCPNEYTFKLSWKYLLLEPTDIVTLTDTISGLAGVPVRITRMSEDGGQWTVTATDYPEGVSAGNGYTPQQGDGLVNNVGSTTGGLTTAFPAAGLTNQGTDLFPNAGSEASPPAYLKVLDDGGTPEFDFRVLIGTGASFTGSISGTTLTAGTPTSGGIMVGQQITGSGVSAGTYVAAQLTGSLGGAGTYAVSISQAAGSTAMTAVGAFSGQWVRELDSDGSSTVTMAVTIPCAPGEAFAFSCQMRCISGGGLALIQLEHVTSGTSISAGITSPGAWTQQTVTDGSHTALVATGTSVTARLVVGAGAMKVQFDALVLRRIVQTTQISPGTANGQVLTMVSGVPTWV